jgi:dihydrofolate reductase
MRKIIYAPIVSLDGYVEDSKGKLDWSVPGEELHQHFNDLYLKGEIDTSIYGRRLYETMLYWPKILNDSNATEIYREFAHIWVKLPKIVFSKTLKKVDWNSTLMSELDAEEIIKLKQSEGANIDIGGAELAAEFMKHGLIDEFQLYVFPLVLGGGKRVFPENYMTKLKHVETRKFACGALMLRYLLK